MRGPDVKVVFAVVVRGAVLKYFYSKDEALGLVAHLEALDEERKPKFTFGPGM